MALREWAEKVIARGSGDDTTTKAALIRLMSDGNTWDTWDLPLELEKFLEQADAMKAAIAEECPIRRVPLMFSAETATGTVLAQYPSSVQGKNKQADALAGAGNGAAKAFAEAMEGISRVVVATLKSAEVQIATVTRTCESQATQIHDLIEYHRTKQELELTEAKENSNTQEIIMNQVKEVLPLLPEAFKIWIADREKSLADAASAVAKVVTQTTTNGAATS